MVKGIGVDIVENSRFSGKGMNFLEKIFTQLEIQEGEKRTVKDQYYASRFAVKEAVSKAMGTGFTSLRPKDVETYEEASGCAKVRIRGMEDPCFYISISHEREYSVAMAIWEEE